MPSPVIYHGASNGNGAWPGGGGGYVPSASMLARDCYVEATTFAINESAHQDNPPRPEWHNFSPGSDWFTRVIAFPPAFAGGSWAETAWYIPANVDVTAGTLNFSILWSPGAVVPTGATSWHVHYTVENPGFPIQGGGPGTVFNQVGVINECMYTPVQAIAPTRGGVPVPLVAGRLCNLNIYRADTDLTLYNAYLFGLAIGWSIVP
jgi:hypothetical protein